MSFPIELSPFCFPPLIPWLGGFICPVSDPGEDTRILLESLSELPLVSHSRSDAAPGGSKLNPGGHDVDVQCSPTRLRSFPGLPYDAAGVVQQEDGPSRFHNRPFLCCSPSVVPLSMAVFPVAAVSASHITTRCFGLCSFRVSQVSLCHRHANQTPSCLPCRWRLALATLAPAMAGLDLSHPCFPRF